jgi:uncharacterized protein (DUF2235 family)
MAGMNSPPLENHGASGSLPTQNSNIGFEKDGFFTQMKSYMEKGVMEIGHAQVPSNVTRIVRAIKPESSDGHLQIVYYQNGVGSSGSFIDHLLGGGLALGLSENIRAAYAFLVNNYQEDEDPEYNDKIFMLGFSRGAFTARSVAGIVSSLGLLRKDCMQYFYDVFEDFEGAGSPTYKPRATAGIPNWNAELKPEHSYSYIQAYADELARLNLTRRVTITAVGVWDTVGSLGLPVVPLLQRIGLPTSLKKYRFFDTNLDPNIQHAFHALALDECRSAFSPTVWECQDKKATSLKQVWFPGTHSDVGGGWPDTATADITLAWMMSQLENLGLDFNEQYLLDQVSANKATYSKGSKWVWGSGVINNSLQGFTALAGKIVRTPDRYHATVYPSGIPKPDLLANTNELIHASVRARKALGGKKYDGKTSYDSDALIGWTSYDGKDGKPARWEYDGTDKDGKGKVMYEDDLGRFETLILSKNCDEYKQLFSAEA